MNRDTELRIRNHQRSGVLVRAVFTGWVLVMLASAASADEKQSLPGATYESIPLLPPWGGWWTFPDALPTEYTKNPPPLKPADVARINEARKADSDPDLGRFCHPPQFVGFSGGFVDSVEFLFTPARVTLTNEGGLIRRIYTDGRPVPTDFEETNTGTSVGHWEGQTLVVETVGVNSNAHYPDHGPGTIPIGKNVRITERITLKDDKTLEFDVTTVAPDILTAPDHRKRLYTRVSKPAAREVSFCVEYDRSIDPHTGKQRFDMTPPKDLPPPPPPAK